MQCKVIIESGQLGKKISSFWTYEILKLQNKSKLFGSIYVVVSHFPIPTHLITKTSSQNCLIHIPDPPPHPPHRIQMRLYPNLLINRVDIAQSILLLIPPRSIPEYVLAQIPIVPRICIARHDAWANKDLFAVKGACGTGQDGVGGRCVV